MPLLITNRLMTKVGTTFLRTARELAQSAYRAKLSNKYQMINGFLIRASGRWTESAGVRPTLEKGSYIASVIDTPGFVVFAGALRMSQVNASLYALGAPVGIRDDFDTPGTDAQFEALGKENYLSIPVPSRIRPSNKPVSTAWFPTMQQREWYMGYSMMDVPLLRDASGNNTWYLDDDQYFNASCIVSLSGSLVSLFTAARPLTIQNGGISFGELRTNYFLRNQYAIDESDLPSRWKLFPRRLVPRSQSGGELYRPPGILMNGFAVIPASSSSVLEGFDVYCHAARTFRQSPVTWGTGFDRDGEQGLLFAVGEQNRALYDPRTGDPVYARTRRMRVIEPTDIDQAYLHPTPAFLPGDGISGRPELPNFGSFLNPTPVQAGNDFVVFSAYLTYLNKGQGPGGDTLSGDAWSIVTTLPSGRTISLKASWAATGDEIPTGTPGEFMQPLIIGAASVPGEDGATAHCLVWEQSYVRGSGLIVKGEWAIYSTNGGSPTRSVVRGFAPLAAVMLARGPDYLNGSAFDTECPLSAAYYAGDNKLVTACTDYPTAASNRAVRCAIFDVNTKSMTVGGLITRSSNELDKCFITVVQKFASDSTGKQTRAAVLLATITQHRVRNNGSGGKVFISIDGGESWREYITDAGAQGGAFYAGNKLWRYDLSLGLDGRKLQ